MRVALIWVLVVLLVVVMGGVVAKLTSNRSFVLDDLDDEDDGHAEGEQISTESGRFMSGGRLAEAICLQWSPSFPSMESNIEGPSIDNIVSKVSFILFCKPFPPLLLILFCLFRFTLYCCGSC